MTRAVHRRAGQHRTPLLVAAALALSGLVLVAGVNLYLSPHRPSAHPLVLVPSTPPPPPSTTSTVAATRVDPGQLPQTHDHPVAAGPAFDARVHGLWQAVVQDDPTLAMPFFFPLTAYQQVKALPNPAQDWQRRLVAAYQNDIHALHLSLGDATTAVLASIDVPDAQALWINPGVETNKIGYYRVYGTTVHYLVDGVKHTFGVISLISWRGEWYVVHLRSR